MNEYLTNWMAKYNQPKDFDSFQELLYKLENYINDSAEQDLIKIVFQFVIQNQNIDEYLSIFLFKILVRICKRTQDKLSFSLLSSLISQKLNQVKQPIHILLYQSLFIDLNPLKYSPELQNSILFVLDTVKDVEFKENTSFLKLICKNYHNQKTQNLQTILSKQIQIIKKYKQNCLQDFNFDIIFQQIYDKLSQIKSMDQQFLTQIQQQIEAKRQKGSFDFIKQNFMHIKQLTPKIMTSEDWDAKKKSLKQVKKDLKKNTKIVQKQLRESQGLVIKEQNLLQETQNNKNKLALKKMHSKFDDANKEYKKMQTTQMQHKKNNKRKGTRMAGNKTEKQVKKN